MQWLSGIERCRDRLDDLQRLAAVLATDRGWTLLDDRIDKLLQLSGHVKTPGTANPSSRLATTIDEMCIVMVIGIGSARGSDHVKRVITLPLGKRPREVENRHAAMRESEMDLEVCRLPL